MYYELKKNVSVYFAYKDKSHHHNMIILLARITKSKWIYTRVTEAAIALAYFCTLPLFFNRGLAHFSGTRFAASLCCRVYTNIQFARIPRAEPHRDALFDDCRI